MKNEFTLDFTGLTVDGAEKEITRYIQAISSVSPKTDTSQKKRLEKLKRLKRLYQKILCQLEKMIAKLESVVACNEINSCDEFEETELRANELLRKQSAVTFYYWFDTQCSIANEAKKPVRLNDLFISYAYQSCIDWNYFSKSNDFTKDFIIKLNYDDQGLKLEETKLSRDVFIRRIMQYSSSVQAEQFYSCAVLQSTIKELEKKGQDSESVNTCAFKTMLASYLFEWRKTNGYTKQDLSQLSGIERTTISNLETMRQSASLDKIIKLLQTTGAGLVIVPIDQTVSE